tara:strand:- start:844 stop:1293 length:450 start_codon:yes stop_codon:yes gene_type:complete
MVTYIPTEYLGSFKEQVVPMLDKAAARSNGRFRGSDFWEMVADGTNQLWLTVDDEENIIGATTTSIYANRNLSVMEIIAHGGTSLDNTHLSEVMNSLEEFAVENDCDVIRIVGRHGWKKVLDKYGYKEEHIVLEKELSDERRRNDERED